MKPRMTAAAWQQGFRNALLCSVLVLAVIGALTAGISGLFRQPLKDSAIFAFCIFWFSIWAVFVIGWLRSRAARGSVTIDCGSHPAKNLFLINACVFLALSIGAGIGFTDRFAHAEIIGGFFGITFSVYWVILASGRLQFTEDGVFQYWSLLRWDRIASWEWAGDARPTLLLRAESRFAWLGRGALPIPAAQRDAVDALLRDRVDGTSVHADRHE